jgi:peptidoglycan/xylan/chitin deacetylase (PgdA/CDA1 family)
VVQPAAAARTVASNLVSQGAARMPLEWLRSLSGVSLVVPYYHMVSDTRVPHVSPLYRFRTVAEFTADVEFLLRRFEAVTLGDIVDALNGKRTLRRPCFHLTFDDGFREMHDIVAPILQRAGAPATFFLNTAFLEGGGLAHHNRLGILLDRLESHAGRLAPGVLGRLDSLLPAAQNGHSSLPARMLSLRYAQKALVDSLAETLDVDVDRYVRQAQPYLSWEQITALLAEGFSIGAHSHDHPLYSDLPLAEQLSQTRLSMELLDARFGLSPKAFAFPHTDGGVGREFFSTVFSERLLDVSFGTGGLVSHFHPRNIERVGMEKTAAPASQILARQFARATYFRLRPR